MTLNLETEIVTYSQIHFPKPYHFFIYHLSMGKYLSVLWNNEDFLWEIWEMKPEEESGEWRKVGTHEIVLTRALKCKAFQQVTYLRLLGWVKYLEVLAFSYRGRTCVFYNLETRESSTIELPERCTRSFVHKNSLVWLS